MFLHYEWRQEQRDAALVEAMPRVSRTCARYVYKRMAMQFQEYMS